MSYQIIEQTERQRDRETERQRDSETGKQRKTVRQRDRETAPLYKVVEEGRESARRKVEATPIGARRK